MVLSRWVSSRLIAKSTTACGFYTPLKTRRDDLISDISTITTAIELIYMFIVCSVVLSTSRGLSVQIEPECIKQGGKIATSCCERHWFLRCKWGLSRLLPGIYLPQSGKIKLTAALLVILHTDILVNRINMIFSFHF